MKSQKAILPDGQLAANLQFALAIAFRPPGSFLVRAKISQHIGDGAKRDACYQFA